MALSSHVPNTSLLVRHGPNAAKIAYDNQPDGTRGEHRTQANVPHVLQTKTTLESRKKDSANGTHEHVLNEHKNVKKKWMAMQVTCDANFIKHFYAFVG